MYIVNTPKGNSRLLVNTEWKGGMLFLGPHSYLLHNYGFENMFNLFNNTPHLYCIWKLEDEFILRRHYVDTKESKPIMTYRFIYLFSICAPSSIHRGDKYAISGSIKIFLWYLTLISSEDGIH